MRKLATVLFVVITALLLADFTFNSSKLIPAKVVKVIDGDTVDVLMNNQTVRVRFIGVNTPEITGGKNEYYGHEAYIYTFNVLKDRQIWLEMDVQSHDKYSRLLAYVWLIKPSTTKSNNREYVLESEIRSKMFNAVLLLEGYAQVMTIPPNVKYADLFVKLEQEARQKQKGLWKPQATQSSKPTQTQTYQQSQSAIYVYITPTGKKYHLAGCRTIKGESTKITLEEAKRRGYEPCRVCNPPK